MLIIYIHNIICPHLLLCLHTDSNPWFWAFKQSFHWNMGAGATWEPVLCRWSPAVWFRNVASLSLTRWIRGAWNAGGGG